MIRDTRWLHPRPNPTPAARRACAQIAAVLAAPPENRSPADLLAEREQLRVEAVTSVQGVLRLGRSA